jgi:hypothetical protein
MGIMKGIIRIKVGLKRIPNPNIKLPKKSFLIPPFNKNKNDVRIKINTITFIWPKK